MKTIWIKQATVDGAIAMDNGGVTNLGSPTSKSRRGRVIDGGNISPTITTQDNARGSIASGYVAIGNNIKNGIEYTTIEELEYKAINAWNNRYE